MFHEYREIMTTMKSENQYFLNMFDKHNELDEKIGEMEKSHADQFEIEKHKKAKLKIKDDIYHQILEYKKKNNI